MEEEGCVEGKENPACCTSAAGPACAADLDAQALQPLGAEAAAALGVRPSEEAEAALAAAGGSAEGDAFVVFSDEGTEELAAAGPAMDPFDPGFAVGLLATLDPPVADGPGVTPVGAEAEAAAAAALKAVRRASGSGGGGAPVALALGGLSFEVSGVAGAGAYATVYRAGEEALKVEAPPCPWEW